MQDHFVGSLLGLALGDALGAKHEGGLAARSLWWLLGLRRPGVLRWSDDTQMTLVLARSLAGHGGIVQDELATNWAREARWSRGYGPGALRILKRVRAGTPWQEAVRSVYPDGSYGNGAAMRVAPIGLFHDDPQERREAAEASAHVTHAHPLGVEGAVLIAEAVHLALHGTLEPECLRAVCKRSEFTERIDALPELLSSRASAKDVSRRLGNRMTAQESCVTALYAYLCFRDGQFEDMVAFVNHMGGDTDTIAAMAGALYGAHSGTARLPEARLAKLEDRPGIEEAARALWARRG
jgi:poly(ADP-ribose) glycohydrolase ARH3